MINKRFVHPCLTAVGLLLSSVPQQAKESSSLEPWVKKCTISSADLAINAPSARAVAGGVSMELHGNWGWCTLVESAEGVLVVHPIARTKPAVIRFKISPLESKAKKLLLMARGSDVEPGVSLRIVARDKTVKDATLGRRWQKIEVPIADLPVSTAEIKIEIHGIKWSYEHCYIDYIHVE